jgi:hypothetical protein
VPWTSTPGRPGQRDHNQAATAFRACGREAGDRGGGELGQGRLSVSQFARDHGGFLCDVDDSPALEEASDLDAVSGGQGENREGSDAQASLDGNDSPW